MTTAFHRALELHPFWTDGKTAMARTAADDKAFRENNLVRASISDGSPAQKVLAFRKLFQLPLPDVLRDLTDEEKNLHYWMLREELVEFVETRSRTEEIDGLLDLIYVAYGALLNYGLSPVLIDSLFSEVHASNLTKVDETGAPVFNQGKVQKTSNYVPPELEEFLSQSGPDQET